MKNSRLILLLLSASVCLLQADQTATPQSGSAHQATDPTLPQPTNYHVTERGANHRIWQRETYVKLPDGHVVPRLHQYTELATGLHYKNAQGEWLESKEEIEAFPGGSIARHGSYQVIFANNLNSAGAIDLQGGDGKRLRSNILGLAYYDRSTGNTALIAQIQDATGTLISANQVLYANAFDGVNADVRYTYKKGSFEQDVILREQPPAPEAYGLNSATTEIEVMTEFINPPKETMKEKRRASGQDADQDISWGVTRLGYGKAFELGAESDFRNNVSVKKQYATINGRKILLELVPLNNIQAGLQNLPKHAAVKSKTKTASKQPMLPRTPLAQATSQPMKLAATAPSSHGYVLDYVEINADQGDYVFRADTTYFLSGPNYYNSVCLEGGTVLKYAVYADIDNFGSVTCKTGPYCPAVLTALDDDTVGEPLPGSSGTPSGYYADFAIGQESAGGSYQYLRIAYATYGLILTTSNTVSNCQFINDASAIACYSDPSVQVQNSLFWQDGMVFDDSYEGFTAGAANITVHDVGRLLGSGVTLSLTNSLLVSVTNWVNFTGVVCATNADADGVFQIAGAGSHYLAPDSPIATPAPPTSAPP